MNTEYYILPTSVTLLLINIDVKKNTINVSEEAREYPVKNNHKSLCLSWCF